MENFCSDLARNFGKTFQVMQNKNFDNSNLIHTALEGMPLSATYHQVEQRLLCHHFDYQQSASNEVSVQDEDIPPINFYELKQAFRAQNFNKAPGSDRFDTRIINFLFKIYPHFLLPLFNKLLSISYFPARREEAIVIFFHKKNKPRTDPASYRL